MPLLGKGQVRSEWVSAGRRYARGGRAVLVGRSLQMRRSTMDLLKQMATGLVTYSYPKVCGMLLQRRLELFISMTSDVVDFDFVNEHLLSTPSFGHCK